MIKTIVIAAVIALLLVPMQSQAARLSTDSDARARCVTHAARTFGVPELPIWVILDVEGGTVGKVSQNTNRTYDIGPMQINSIWLKHIAPFGITESQVKNNLCMNIYVGTWIFTKELERHKTLAKALAYYHSPTPKHQHRYLGLIQKAIDRRLAKLRKEKSVASSSSTRPKASS